MPGKTPGPAGATIISPSDSVALWSKLYVDTTMFLFLPWSSTPTKPCSPGAGPPKTESVCKAESILLEEAATSQPSCTKRPIMSPGIYTASGFKTTARRSLESLSTAWLWRKLRRALPWRLRRVLAALSGRVQKKRFLGGAPLSQTGTYLPVDVIP